MRPCPPDMQSGPGSLVSEATPYLNWLVGNKTNQANLGAMTFPRKLFVLALSKLTVIWLAC